MGAENECQGGAGERAAQWRLSPPARRGGPFTRAAAGPPAGRARRGRGGGDGTPAGRGPQEPTTPPGAGAAPRPSPGLRSLRRQPRRRSPDGRWVPPHRGSRPVGAGARGREGATSCPDPRGEVGGLVARPRFPSASPSPIPVALLQPGLAAVGIRCPGEAEGTPGACGAHRDGGPAAVTTPG